jgi:hypothetical protein
MVEGQDPRERNSGRLVSNPAASAPTISLPKGGGAIRGIGEKFGANPVTGTASMTVPIPANPTRSDFGPQLSLSYDSGAGNGPFGMGWSLGLPQITRKTGVPRYNDAQASDVFILSGAEELDAGFWGRTARDPTTTPAPRPAMRSDVTGLASQAAPAPAWPACRSRSSIRESAAEHSRANHCERLRASVRSAFRRCRCLLSDEHTTGPSS